MNAFRTPFQTLLRKTLLASLRSRLLRFPGNLKMPKAVRLPRAPAAKVPKAAKTAKAPGIAKQVLIDGHHTEAAGTRRFKLFVPPGHSRGPRALVVMLHGCTQDAANFAAGTRMNALAARDGFVVLYPEQANANSPQRCWNWFKHNHQARGKGEPAILAGMVRAVSAAQGIDPRRIYVAGLSAGGAMAAILGDAYPDLFAAVGVHSGLATGAARSVQSALAAMRGTGPEVPRGQPGGPPTIVFHGDQDSTVHPVNGERVLARASYSQTVEQQHGEQGRGYTRRIHRDAQGHIRAEHWLVHGAGHAWSGGSAQGSHTDPRGPDASAEMLRFFGTHVLPVGR